MAVFTTFFTIRINKTNKKTNNQCLQQAHQTAFYSHVGELFREKIDYFSNFYYMHLFEMQLSSVLQLLSVFVLFWIKRDKRKIRNITLHDAYKQCTLHSTIVNNTSLKTETKTTRQIRNLFGTCISWCTELAKKENHLVYSMDSKTIISNYLCSCVCVFHLIFYLNSPSLNATCRKTKIVPFFCFHLFKRHPIYFYVNSWSGA